MSKGNNSDLLPPSNSEQYYPDPLLHTTSTEADAENQTLSNSRITQRFSFSHSMYSVGNKSIKSAFGDYLEVNESGKFTITPTLPPFGGGKEYPSLLPNHEIYTVEWDGPDDPNHPYNWTVKRKIPVALINGLNIIVVCWGSSVYSGGLPQVLEEFNVSKTIGLLGISIYILGFASGPIIWAPASELFGRKYPQLLSLLGFTIFSAASAVAKDIQTLLITRFFTGFLGAAPLAIVPAVYSDTFPAATRGYVLAIFTFAAYFGPMLGPVVGSFIAKNPSYGWRWTEYVTAIMGGVTLALNIFFLEETYHSQLLVQKAKSLRRLTGNWGIQARLERDELNFNELVSKNLIRPIKMLCTEPILFLINLFQSFLYGIMYMLLEAYPVVFHDGYKMHQGQDILPYFALILGQFLGCIICIAFEPYYLRRLNQNGGKAVPEARLPANIVGGIFLPIGLLWFAWSGNYPEVVHWMVPAVSGVATGIALTTIFLCCTTYLVDCYTQFAASAMAANVFMRSLFGFGFPLFATQMFKNLGVGWAGTLLGLIGVLMAPVPLFFYIYGPKIRARSKYSSI
ncbi:putative MFS multidrug transporter [Nadsonia fulvescens var. elongata DSM 6958]|uniref:Putative MFS multidrug transporter n=1 Tax=Nadsonia fulvescens var. elongata DSM 6958 TaxID=857566 RepID=A0A1E3PN55_9ASCO|nr:putative MFS multidrug transporter [Nadsonia fulvescens var. elongata DSM 6958]